MADRHDENLPEVVPDSSPQTLTSAEAFDRRGLDEGHQKYTVVNDQSKPKMANPDAFMGDAETPTTPAPAYRPYTFGADGGGGGGGTAGAVAPDPPNPGNTEAGLEKEKAQPKILGLKRRTFIIVLVVAIVVIAAAIGGGVGGSQAAKKSGNSAEDSAGAEQETLSPTSTAATHSSPPPTSTSRSGSDDDEDDTEDEEEDKDKDDDEPGFDFKGWEDPDYTGSSTDLITEKGFIDLPFNVTSYKWRPNDSDCCITFCQGKEKGVGWRCTDFDRDESTSEFGRIFIGCGNDKTQENSRCS